MDWPAHKGLCADMAEAARIKETEAIRKKVQAKIDSEKATKVVQEVNKEDTTYVEEIFDEPEETPKEVVEEQPTISDEPEVTEVGENVEKESRARTENPRYQYGDYYNQPDMVGYLTE